MKAYRFFLPLVFVTLAGWSCSDNFFDLEPNDKVAVSKVYKTAQDFNLATVGCYAKLQTQVSIYTECCEFRSDNLFLSAPTAGTQDRYDIDQFKDKPSNGILSDAWANFNNNVYRCNLILDQIDGANIDEVLKKQYKGEALFIRALSYLNMYRIWGGVPTTRTVVSALESRKIARSTDDQMYNLIVGDLKAIVDENMLPAAFTGDNIGRATSGAAMALLGKACLTFHKWEEAKDALAQVIDSYSLLTDPSSIFDVANRMNAEIIFAVRFNKTIEGEGHGYWNQIANLTDDTNQTPQILAAYNDPVDNRKELITYMKVPGESSVCVIRKFLDVKDPTTKTTGNDQILLRYADVLLMYAEALNEIAYSNQSDSPALNALNAVHTRAGLAAIDISTLTNKDSFRDAIALERQRELPYEGHRWFDLVRMGKAKTAMAANGHAIQDYQLLFPIPQSEIERVDNKSILWQNNGY